MGEAKDEIELAQDEIKKINELWFISWEKDYVTKYVEMCDELVKSIDSFENLTEGVKGIAAFTEKLVAAVSKMKQAFDYINTAVNQNNARSHSAARSNCDQAITLCNEAESLLNEANTMQEDAGLDPVVSYASGLKALASLQRQCAEAGSAGKVAAYNRLINEFNVDKSKLNLNTPPVISDTQGWVQDRLKKYLDDIKEHANKADELRKEIDSLYWANH